ncbi:MAG: YkvA family protein [Pseudomonadota bacterium]
MAPRKGPVRPLFRPRRARRELDRILSRTARSYRPLYRGGRSKALDRAEELAKEKAASARDMTEADVEAQTAEVERGFWPKLKRVARQIPFLEDLVAAYYAVLDRKTPLQVRAALAFALIYFLWMFDIIPDFIGIAGFADDGTVLATVIAQVGGAITEEHRRQAREALGMETA